MERGILKVGLEKYGYEVTECADGNEVLSRLGEEDAPELLILDWMMPEMSGPEICKALRMHQQQRYVYILLLTSKDQKADLIEGLESGADDYLIKPLDMDELEARLHAGQRVLRLQSDLLKQYQEIEAKNTLLEKQLREIHQLRGLLPICVCCKKIRQDMDYWEEIDVYITKHSDASFTHGLCPNCLKKEYPDWADSIETEDNAPPRETGV
jgi:CheY-like chemotaxis protein